MLRNPVWFHVLLAFALAVPGAAQTPGGGASILGLELGTKAADTAVTRALREPGRGPADAARAGRLFDLARSLEARGRDDLAVVIHRAIVEQHPTAVMPSGIAGTTYAEESYARIGWLTGDRSWLAPGFPELYRGIRAALARHDPVAIAALAPPDVRVGPFRACPDGWWARDAIAKELAAGGSTTGALELDGAEQAWFRVTVAGGAQRVIVMGLARGRAEWQAYCYEPTPETAAPPVQLRVTKVPAGGHLHLRAAPDNEARELGEIPWNATDLEPRDGRQGDWQRVRWHGVEGWASTRYLQP